MAADPLFVFHVEHETIRPQLRAFETRLDAAMNRGAADAADLAAFHELLAFLRAFVFGHFWREEEALLKVLEKEVGRFGTLVNVIACDHEEVRREAGKLGQALAALDAAAGTSHRSELAEVNRHGIFLVQYLGLHMAKEDSALADAAREALGEDGLQEVARRLESMR
jgi:hemerythrin-like domain-containing protein